MALKAATSKTVVARRVPTGVVPISRGALRVQASAEKRVSAASRGTCSLEARLWRETGGIGGLQTEPRLILP
jgi:hypothetical protein